MATARKPVPMCCVTIRGYLTLVMPTDKGLKLVDILQSSVDCQRDYDDRGFVYTLKEAPEVEFTTVQPKQIKFPNAHQRPGRLLLEGD